MIINTKVLMSGADYFDVVEINPYSYHHSAINRDRAIEDFNNIRAAIEQAGVEVIKIDAPKDCQDGIFVANWALCKGNKAVLSYLPGPRQSEQPHAEKALQELGYQTIKAPFPFSGQGDALICGKYVFVGSGYRTDERMHHYLQGVFKDVEVVGLRTIPERDKRGEPVINALSGWADSPFYDMDLAIAVITPDLIAWCPDAFTPESRERINAIKDIEKIEVSFKEAKEGFACNLVSTGETVVMGPYAPELQAELEKRGFKVITPEIKEIIKGGGFIRCSTLTLSN